MLVWLARLLKSQSRPIAMTIVTQAIPNRKVSVKVQGADGHAYFMSIDARHLTVSKDETANKICWHHGTGDSVQYHSLHYSRAN